MRPNILNKRVGSTRQGKPTVRSHKRNLALWFTWAAVGDQDGVDAYERSDKKGYKVALQQKWAAEQKNDKR